MRPIGSSPSRRAFLGRVLAAAPAIAAVSGEITHPARALVASAPPKQNQPEIYQPKYFTTEEWTLLTALVDRLIPADEEGPGALEAGAAEFIDRQMTEPYGHGALWYMQGPFRQASPEFGYQLKYTPRKLYRAALPTVDQAVRVKHGKAFTDLGDDAKDAVIGELLKGIAALAPPPRPQPAEPRPIEPSENKVCGFVFKEFKATVVRINRNATRQIEILHVLVKASHTKTA